MKRMIHLIRLRRVNLNLNNPLRAETIQMERIPMLMVLDPPQSPPPQRPTTPLFLVCVLEVVCMLWGAVVSVADGELIVDFGDDARSVVTSATQRTSATARTEKTTATATTAKTKKKDVIPPSALPFPSPSHSFCSLVSFVFRVDGGLMIG
jgi:hypothetical protein